MDSRVSLLASLLPEFADAALIVSQENRRYFTGFVSSAGYLLVTRSEAYLLVDFRYGEAAQKNAENCKVITFKKLSDTLCGIITENRLKKIMLEGSSFTLNDAAKMDSIISSVGAETVKSSELDKIISRLRIIKTADEVEKIRKAQRITEDSFSETIKLIKEGVTERDIALELEYKMRKKGADGISFDLIVISGKKTSMPHGVPGNEKIKNGDFITFDIGAVVDGYHSDMTRTVSLGNVDNKQRRVYDTVLTAQLKGIDAVRDGVSCGAVDNVVRSYIDQAGFQGRFGHSTGHGVGLEIHEQPSVSPDNDLLLRSGMIITIEPGIYLPDEFGVRIEDMVAVTNGGCINLATFPKELIIL